MSTSSRQTSTSKLGQQGETQVVEWLKAQDFVVEARNYRQRFGEIDIIAKRGNLLAFVEVKTRRNRFFDLSQLIVPSKQAKIIATAKHYLACHPRRQEMILRFDVALLTSDGSNYDISYVPNAFMPSSNERCH